MINGHFLASLCSLRCRRRPRRFADLITAHLHRNSPTHAVEDVPQAQRTPSTCGPPPRQPESNYNLATETSFRIRRFTSETWLRLCGSPGVRDPPPDSKTPRDLLDLKKIPCRIPVVSTSATPSLRVSTASELASQCQPPPATIILALSYEFCFCMHGRTCFLIFSPTQTQFGRARAKPTPVPLR